jgi:hypothetical protein
MAYSVVSQHRVHRAGGRLEQVLADWHKQTAASDAAGQRALASQLLRNCQHGVTCGRTVDGVVAMLPSATSASTVESQQQLRKATAQVTRELATADETAVLTVVVPTGLLSIAVLAMVGLQPRLDEYRYRSRQ